MADVAPASEAMSTVMCLWQCCVSEPGRVALRLSLCGGGVQRMQEHAQHQAHSKAATAGKAHTVHGMGSAADILQMLYVSQSNGYL